MGEVLANNNDPLDVFCGAFLCNAHAVAPAMSCKVEENASSTVVGKTIYPRTIAYNFNLMLNSSHDISP